MIKKIIIKLYRKVKQWDQVEQYNLYRKRYNLHKTFRFNGGTIYIYGKGNLSAGENSYIGSGSTIQLEEMCSVSIGKNCRISHNVRIYTSSAIADQDFSHHDSLRKSSGNVTIENNVWIGVNVFINPGVTIGENSVVGANSVVTKDIPPFSIFGGVPAKLIRYKDRNA